MNRIQTKALVEGAIFAAITVVIGIITFYIPLVALISIVWSVPTILIAFRHGFKVSIYSVVVSSVLVAVVTQPIEGLRFFIVFGLPGIVMGYLLNKNVRPEKTIFFTSIVLSICGIAGIYLGMLALGVNIENVYDKFFLNIKSAYVEAANAYRMMGVSREEIAKTTEIFEKNLDLMKLILPGVIFLSGVLLSFMNFKLTKLVLKRINYSIEDVKPFSQWRLSNKGMLFVTAMLLFAVVETSMIRLPQLNALATNIFTVMMMVFMVLGFSVSKFFLDKYSVPKVFKGVFLFFALFSFSQIMMLVGVLDMAVDIRKLRNKSAGDVR
ncbi:MAG: YybS family protein [Clostridia bacterium]|nr:YybS family protein [Clostridia bacterium]